MYKGIGFFLVLSVGSVLSASAAESTDTGEQRVHVTRTQQTLTGPETQFVQSIPAKGVISTITLPNRSQPLVHTQATAAQRVLIRLKSPATQPYLKQQRTQLNATGKLSRADQQALSKTTRSYRQGLQKSQAQLVDTLRSKKYLQQVHNHFVDLTNTVNATVPANSLVDIRALPQVAEVYLDNPINALLDKSVPVTEAPELWAMRDGGGNNITGRGITVAILDTGVDYTHPDLGGCVGVNCKIVAGYNFVNGEDSANFMDKHGHGTHVAGIVAANGLLRGVAPDAQLYAYKVLDDSGSGSESSIIAALEKAVDPDGDPLTQDQIDIVNMSLGGPGRPDSPLSEAADNAMQAGTLVVVAAGNSGSDYSTIGSPGNAEQVLTVGASNNTGDIADFSSRGPIAGKSYVKPEMVAPGVDINSAAPGALYSVKSGTSMATPHVAGGAALLKQYYPQLTAAELKDLLISSAADLGKDIFAQGAGAMKLKAAINAKLLVTPRLLSAGRVDLQQSQFSRDVSFRVKNISNETQAISFLSPTSLPAGTIVNMPAGLTSLAVGDSANFSVKLNVDTATLPFADSNSLHHKVVGSLQFNGQTMNLPLVFSKAALLEIKWSGKPFTLMLFNDDGSYIESLDYPCDSSPLANAPASEAVYVKPGVYHVVTSFLSDNCFPVTSLVFNENIKVETNVVVEAKPESAIYDIAVGEIVDVAGNSIPSSELISFLTDVSWAREGIDSLYQTIGVGNSTGTLIKVSGMSEKIKFNATTLLKPVGTTERSANYYFLQGQFPTGVDSNKALSLDARTSAGVDFYYADPVKLKEGVTLNLGISQLSTLSSTRMAYGKAIGSLDLLHEPVNISLFSDISTFAAGEWYPVFGFDQKPQNDPMAWAEAVFSTGALAFEDASSFTKLRNTLSIRAESLYKSKDRNLVVKDDGFFFSGSFSYYLSNKRLAIIDVNNFNMSHRLIRDSQQNIFFKSMPYRVLCNQSIIKIGATRAYDGFEEDADFAACSKQVWEFDMPTSFQGKDYVSTAAVSLDASNFPEFGYTVDSPILQQLMLLSDGVSSRILSGNNLELRITAKADRWPEAILPDYSLIEYRLDDSPDWIQLHSETSGKEFVARLPDIAGSRVLSLRITLRNSQKVTLTQTLNGVALIGNDSEPAPVFEPLPALTTEATGPLTAFTLLPVTAKDSKGQAVIASTTDLGPYALGAHQIRWQAKNAIGKVTEAIQLLTIRDTTPPGLTVPADIRMTAISTLTPVTLGEATAVDLVDGAIVVSASNKGPFAVGTHRINWTATDKSGNAITASQQLIIDPKPPSTGSGNGGGSSGGGSGGGGNSGVWLLLLLSGFILRRFVQR